MGTLNFNVLSLDGFGKSWLSRHYRLHLANRLRTPDVNGRSIEGSWVATKGTARFSNLMTLKKRLVISSATMTAQCWSVGYPTYTYLALPTLYHYLTYLT